MLNSCSRICEKYREAIFDFFFNHQIICRDFCECSNHDSGFINRLISAKFAMAQSLLVSNREKVAFRGMDRFVFTVSNNGFDSVMPVVYVASFMMKS